MLEVNYVELYIIGNDHSNKFFQKQHPFDPATPWKFM